MLIDSTVAWNGVLLLVEGVWLLNGAALRQGVPGSQGDGLLSSSPPSELASVGKNDTWGVIFVGRAELRLDVFHKVNCRTFRNTALAPNNSMSEYTEVLGAFAKEDNNSFLGFDIG